MLQNKSLKFSVKRAGGDVQVNRPTIFYAGDANYTANMSDKSDLTHHHGRDHFEKNSENYCKISFYFAEKKTLNTPVLLFRDKAG